MLERIVQAAGRRPGRVLLAVAVVAGISAALALRLEPSTATDTLVGKGSDTYQATEVYRERFGDHAIIVLVRGDLQRLVLTDNLGRLLGLEGCLSGNKPKDEPAPGGKGSPCAEFARTKPVKVVYGPGTFINSAVGEINDQFQRQLGSKAQEAERAKVAAQQAGRGAGPQQGAAEEGGRRGRAARLRAVHARPAPAQPEVRARPQGAAADRRPGLRLDAGVRPVARVEDPEGALRLPVPELEVGRHPGAAQARPDRGAAAARDRAGARRGRDEGVEAHRRRGLPRDGRAGGGRGPRVGADRVAAAAARGRAAGDGGRARARVPQPPAAAPAGGRAGGGGDHVRGDVAARRVADDGVDRGAAGAARARGRLRDPVPGARRGGRRARMGVETPRRPRTRRARRCRRSPPPRSRPRSGSSCCCCRRCRWCAASACCSWPASRSRSSWR